MLEVSRKELVKALALMGKVIKSKRGSSLPILHNVQISVKNEKIFLTATDLEAQVTYEIDCKTDGSSIKDVIVPEKVFENLVNSFTSDTVFLNLHDSFLEVKSKNNLYKIEIVNDEFPSLVVDEDTKELEFQRNFLRTGFKKVHPFVGLPERVRQEFTFVFVEKKEDKVKIMGTEGYKLALFRNGFFKKEEANDIFLIPGSSINILSDIISKEVGEKVVLGFGTKTFYYRGQKVFFVSRLGQGKPPPYETVFPKDYSEVVMNRKELEDALTRLKNISERVKFYFTSNEVQMRTIEGAGEGMEIVSPSFSAVNGIELVFAIVDLLKVLKQIDQEEVVFRITEPERPVEILGKGDETFTCVVMTFRNDL